MPFVQVSAASFLSLALAAFAAPSSAQSSAAPPKAPEGTKAPAGPSAAPAPKAGDAAKEPTGGDAEQPEGKKGKGRAAGIWYGVQDAPKKQPGTIRLAAYNVENLFDDVDDPTLQGEYDDIKMVTKPARLQAIADEIRKLDADVLCIEEMESFDCLKWFRDKYLKDMGYQYAYSEDVGYYRGIEQACLSRYPISAHETFVKADLSAMDALREGEGWAGKKTDQGKKFQRSPLKVRIDVDGMPMTIYCTHLKAGGKEFDFQRESEALQIAEFVKADLAADPHACVAVVGDFNATPSAKAAKVLPDHGMRTAYEFRAVKKGNTKDLYTTHDSGRAIDYIFMSPDLAGHAVDGGFFVLGTMHNPGDYDWKTDPNMEKVAPGYASDHCPVAIDLAPKGAKAVEGKPEGKTKPAEAK